MPKVTMFEWSEIEEFILTSKNLNLPAGIKTYASKFDITKALGSKVVSVFVDSVVTKQDLIDLKKSGTQALVVRATGLNNIDTNAARELGIKVINVPAYSPESIAEHVFALTLYLTRRLNNSIASSSDFSRSKDNLGVTLHGQVLGLYGLGKIGLATAKIALGFGMTVIAYDAFAQNTPQEIEMVNSLDMLFKLSNIVSVHVPLNESTKDSVNWDIYQQANADLILINTARGGVVNVSDTIKALDTGKLAFLGVDVWGDDDKKDSRLLRPNVVQTNHIAYLTRQAVYEILLKSLKAVVQELKS